MQPSAASASSTPPASQGFRPLLEQSATAQSEADWDTANAAFHGFQIDLADNEILSRVYREMPVNLIVQVIRGGRLAGGGDLVHEHRAIVAAFEAGDLPAAQLAIRKHITSGKAIVLDVIERAGGVL